MWHEVTPEDKKKLMSFSMIGVKKFVFSNFPFLCHVSWFVKFISCLQIYSPQNAPQVSYQNLVKKNRK